MQQATIRRRAHRWQRASGLRRPARSATNYLGLAGIVGPPMFVLVFTLAGLQRDGYSAIRDAVSDLGVGQDSWIQNANFFVSGTFLVLFGIAFLRAAEDLVGRRRASVGAVLITLSGLGILGSGVFTAAPETEILHFILGFQLAFGSAIASITFVGWQLRRVVGWEGLARYSLLTAGGAVLLIGLSFAALNPESPLEEIGVGGLLERALAVEVFAWHVVFGWRLFRERGADRVPAALS